jgi:hypothetical protein
MWQLKAVGAILLSLMLCASVAAQGGQKRKGTSAKKRGGSVPEAPTLEQQYALGVLDQLLSSSKEFEDERLRVRTQAQVADILWRYDEPRARGLFKEAFEAAASAKLESWKEGGAPGAPFGAASPRVGLQSEVLKLAARRDPDLAETLIGSLKEARGDDSTPPDGADSGGGPGLYLEAAMSIADTNPHRAVRLAETGLGGGINPSVLSVLYALRRSNRAQADALYRSVLAAARRDSGHTSVNFTVLASYALPDFSRGGPPPPDGEAADPLVVELLDFAFETYMGLAFPAPAAPGGAEARPPAAPNPIDYMTGQKLLPYFTRYRPEKAVQFRASLETIAGRLKQNSLMESVQRLSQAGSADELEKQADSVKDSFQRDLLYFRAALTASGAGEFERALSLAGKVSGEDFRGGLESVIRFQASSELLAKGEIDSSLRYAEAMSDVRQRAFQLAKIARTLLGRNNAPRASEVLTEAEKTLARAKDGSEKAQALLIITEVRMRLDPTQGMESMEGTVKAFNEADAAPAARPAAPGSGALMTAMLASMLTPEAPDFAPSFYLLARTDFNRAAQLARQLTRKERAVSALLAACRGVLEQKPD